MKNNYIKEHNKKKRVQKFNGPFYYFVWIFKIELLILVICLIIKLIPEKEKFSFYYNIEKILNSNPISNMYSVEHVSNSINNNRNLNNIEKEFINRTLEDELNENQNYINIQKCMDRFKNLDIKYKNREEDQRFVRYSLSNNLYIMGNYSEFFNEITLYSDDNVHNIESCNLENLFHELNHLISKNSIKSYQKINVLSETINEIFSREYYYKFSDCYEYDTYREYMAIGYLICELLPEEDIRKYKFTDDLNVLASALLKIDNNEDKAYSLVNSNYIDNNFLNCYNYFYYKKYKENMMDNEKILIYLYNSNLQNYEYKTKIYEKLNLNQKDKIISVIPKGYFSNNYKNENPTLKIIVLNDNSEEVIEIL